MKRYTYHIILALLVLTMATSCVKDKLYLLPEEDEDFYDPNAWKQAALTVNTIWNETDIIAPPENGYLIDLNGKKYETNNATYNLRRILAGDYSVFAYNRPKGVTIDENFNATVDKESDGTYLRMPDFLYSSQVENVKILRNSTSQVDLKMHQLIHELVINIYMWPGDENLVSNITGTLSGVIDSVNLLTFEKGTEVGEILMPMTLTYMEYDGQDEELIGKMTPVYQAVVRFVDLLEVEDGQLAINVTYADGSIQTFRSILKPDTTLAEFDFFVKEIGGMGASIIDWHDVDNGYIIIR